jgi:hypothetical protein
VRRREEEIESERDCGKYLITIIKYFLEEDGNFFSLFFT